MAEMKLQPIGQSALATALLVLAGTAWSGNDAGDAERFYSVHPLVSDGAQPADHVDASLRNRRPAPAHNRRIADPKTRGAFSGVERAFPPIGYHARAEYSITADARAPPGREEFPHWTSRRKSSVPHGKLSVQRQNGGLVLSIRREEYSLRSGFQA
jgi:hypothetical protein